MGYNDFTALRQSLSDIEEKKIEIDGVLRILRMDVAKQKNLKEKKIPSLKLLKSQLQKEKLELTHNLALENQKLSSANDESIKLQSQSESYDVSNHVKNILSKQKHLNHTSKINRKVAGLKKDKLQFKLSMFFAVFFVVMLSALSYSVLGDLKEEKVYTCPDGITEVGYYELVNGVKDCPSGWDEEDSFWGTEDGQDAYSGLELFVAGGCFVTFVMIVASIPGGFVMSEFVFDKYAEKIATYCGSDDGLQAAEFSISSTPVLNKSKRLQEKCKELYPKISEHKETIERMGWRLETIKRSESKNVEDDRASEHEIVTITTQIPQHINDIRNNSTRIQQIFDGVKHLIPNSENVSLNSPNLEEILDEITDEIN